MFFSEPRKVLFFTFCVGIILAVINIFFSGFIYGDAVLYTTMAHYFGLGDYARGFLDGIPPLFPVIGGLLCKLGIPAQYATHIASCSFCILTIFPLYLFLCFFLEKKYAAWGCMFYLFAPKILRFGMASQIEGARFFFFILPIYFVFSFVKNKKNITLVWLGVSLALAALIRGEGIIFVPIMLFALILLLWKGNKYRISTNFIMKALGCSAISILVMSVVIAPRMYQVYTHTGYPVLDTREAGIVKNYSQRIRSFFVSSTSSEIMPDGSNQTISFDPDNRGYIFSFKRVFSFLNRFSAGTFELYEILFVFGAFFLLWQRKWTLEHSIMLMIVIGNAFVFYFTVLTYRYFLVNILLLMPFIVTGYVCILNIVKKHRTIHILFLTTVLFVALGQIENGMADSLESKRKEPKRFGVWLEANKAALMNLEKSSNERLYIMVIGNRPDYPFFANADFCLYENKDFNPNMEISEKSETNIEKAIKGFPAEYGYYSNNLLPSDKIIIPDVIVVTSPDDYPKEVKTLRTLSDLKEIKVDFEDILLFKNLN